MNLPVGKWWLVFCTWHCWWVWFLVVGTANWVGFPMITVYLCLALWWLDFLCWVLVSRELLLVQMSRTSSFGIRECSGRLWHSCQPAKDGKPVLNFHSLNASGFTVILHNYYWAFLAHLPVLMSVTFWVPPSPWFLLKGPATGPLVLMLF